MTVKYDIDKLFLTHGWLGKVDRDNVHNEVMLDTLGGVGSNNDITYW